MYAIIILLLALTSTQARDPAHLKPGALTANIGRVSLIQDYLWVRYPYTELKAVPGRLLNLTEQLSDTLFELNKHTIHDTKYSSLMKMLLKERVEFLRDTVKDALENYDGFPSNTRSKRGLIDGLGMLSQMMFGTAMDSDVKELQERYNNLAAVAISNRKAVDLNCRNIARLNEGMIKLVNYTNILGASLNKAFLNIDVSYAIDEVFMVLNALENSVNTIMHANDLVLRNVVDASRGRVSSSLFPVKDLLHTLTLAEEQYDLTPNF